VIKGNSNAENLSQGLSV